MSLSRNLRRAGSVLCLILFLVNPLPAQIKSGAISGTVLDPDEAGMSNVTVTLVNPATEVKTQTLTNDVGSFKFLNLDPGTYTVEFMQAGFQTSRVDNVIVGVDERVVNRKLAIATVASQVDVTAEVPGSQLAKADPHVQFVIMRDMFETIPYPTTNLAPGGARNQSRVALIAPGIVRVTGQNEFSAAGHRGRDNNWLIDGVENNDNSVTLPAVLVPPESTEAIQIQVASFSAAVGRNSGAQVNVITRSGTKDHHGELWNFYRNSAMEPLSLQSQRAGLTKTPRLIDNQFGASFGGPLSPGRTFFFGAFQGNLQRQAARTISPVVIPTAAGYEALKNVPLRTGQSAASRQAVLDALAVFPGLYPAVRRLENISNLTIDPQDTSLAPVNIEIGTYFPTVPDKQNLWYGGFRLDHNLTQTDALSYRFHIDHRSTPLAGSNLAFGERWAADNKWFAQNHALSYTKNIGARFINQARMAYTRLDPTFVERDPVSPTVTISNYFTLGGLSTFPQERLEQNYQLQNVSTYSVGRHSLQFGIDLVQSRLFTNTGANSKGTWVFPNFTAFLNNSPTQLTQLLSEPAKYSFRQLRQNYFLQDDIKITPNFTANIGIRYETASVPLGLFGTTDPALLAALVPGPVKRDTNNFAPRIGFAYSPTPQSGFWNRVFGDGKSSVRGGFGMAYDPIFYALLSNIAPNYPRTNQQVNTASELIDVFPALTPKNPVIPAFSPTLNFVNFPSDSQNPTTHYWTLSVQRQFGGETGQDFILELGYIGNRSYHLLRQGQANPGVTSPEKAAAVLAGCTAATISTCTNPPGFPNSPARLNPTLGQRTLLETTGQGEYHGGYAQFTRKIGHALRFGANYTFSADFSDSEEIFNDSVSSLDGGIAASSPQIPQDYSRRDLEWSRSVFDRPHRFSIHYAYRIPWFANSSALLDNVFEGWQLSGFWEIQSGQPFTIRVGVDTLGLTNNATSARPDYNPGGILIPDPETGNLRTFRIPLDGTGIVSAPHVTSESGQVTFLRNSMPNGGTLGRNTFRGPSFNNANMSLMKRFDLPSEKRVEIRADFVNVFNHDNLPNPIGDMSSANFGRNILQPFTDARQVLLGAKIAF